MRQKRLKLILALVSILLLSSCGTKTVYVEPKAVKLYKFPVKKEKFEKLEIDYEIRED